MLGGIRTLTERDAPNMEIPDRGAAGQTDLQSRLPPMRERAVMQSRGNRVMLFMLVASVSCPATERYRGHAGRMNDFQFLDTC